MNRKIKSIIIWLMTAILCLIQPLSLFSVKASETTEIDLTDAIHVSSVADLEKLAENCIVDSWSRDKIVILDKDIDLGSADFSPIPTFGGIFLGQKHTITGLKLEGGSDYTGLFRYIQESGEIHDLNLSGQASADSTHLGLALLAGCNNGLIHNCQVSGEVTGGDYAGILAGLNGSTGVIKDCHTAGTLYGNHIVGSVAGGNEGTILNCNNKCDVNITVLENSINLSSLTIHDLFSTENVASITDIGGITGSNSGVIRACVNNGSVGYQHVGYNIGGIAGSQSGYIEGCVNYGVLNGRKDVGGIAGQMEPSSEIEYLEDTLDKLDPELDKLHDLVTKMTDDASGASTEMTDQTDRLLRSVKNAQNAVENISSQASIDMSDFSHRLTDISYLPTPEPVSLEFLDKKPSPSVSPTPSETPTESPGATSSISPDVTPSESPSATPSASQAPSASPTSDLGPLASYLPTLEPGATYSPWPSLDPDYSFEYDFDREAAEKEINKLQNNVYRDASDIMDIGNCETR